MNNTPTNSIPTPSIPMAPIDLKLYNILGPHIVHHHTGRIFAICQNKHQHLAHAALKAKGHKPKP